MKRRKLLLAGLVAGAVALGAACRTDRAAERDEPAEPPASQEVPSEDAGTGGAGFEYKAEDDEVVEGEPFGDDEELGGHRFPTDDIMPRW